MPRIKHKHAWRMSIHVDGCHSHTSTYVCAEKCGHVIGSYTERDPEADPYSLIWMEPEYDENGEPLICQRCTELQNGAPAEHRLSVTR